MTGPPATAGPFPLAPSPEGFSENGPCPLSSTMATATASATRRKASTWPAPTGWICDIVIDGAHRGHGLGKRLMDYLAAHPDLQGFRRLHLATRDAHGLYRQYGFAPLTGVDAWMEKRDPDVYRHR
jgi:GNAT superfamily N-acetyltransferase